MYEVGQIYSLNYKTGQNIWVAFYVHITQVNLTYLLFNIAEVFADTEHGLFQNLMDRSIPMEKTFEQFEAMGPMKVKPNELKYSGRCPKCAQRGEFVRMALVCKVHGAYAGI